MPESSPRATDAKPDILLLMTDQQRFDTIAAAGHAHMHTPNMDRLVRQGCLFTHAYTPVPICQPARYHTLTGTTARHHGLTVNAGDPIHPAIPTLPRLLRDADYDTRAIGKMHFIPIRADHGFHCMELMEEHPADRSQDEYAMHLQAQGHGHIMNLHGIRNILYEAPQRCLVPDELHGSAWVADRTIDYLKHRPAKQPFFCWSSWIAPHPPFNMPDGVAELYRDAPLPPPLVSRTTRSPFTQIMSDDNTLPPASPRQRAAYMRRRQEAYHAMISHVDQQIGRVLDTLEQLGRLDNTFIIFTSDHGEMLGDHGSHQKAQPYESATRIPFIIRYPQAFAPGSVNHEFVDLNDILPTILHAAGVHHPQPAILPGSSLLGEHDPVNPALSRDRATQHLSLGSHGRRWATVRNEQYKYTHYYSQDHPELYDMLADPGETTNLLDRSAMPVAEEIQAIRDELHQQLERYEARWGPADHCDSQGRMKTFPPPPSTTMQELYDMRARQFPRPCHRANTQSRRSAMDDFAAEALRAVEHEPLSSLARFDLAIWKSQGVSPEFFEALQRRHASLDDDAKADAGQAAQAGDQGSAMPSK